jgi:hypothetical protein
MVTMRSISIIRGRWFGGSTPCTNSAGDYRLVVADASGAAGRLAPGSPRSRTICSSCTRLPSRADRADHIQWAALHHTTLAVSIATLVPAPIAMPMSAPASAEALFTHRRLSPPAFLQSSAPAHGVPCRPAAFRRRSVRSSRDGLGPACIVAGDHHRLDAQLPGALDRVFRSRLDGISHSDQPGCASVDCLIH